jgi:hypothetical protein
MVVPIQVESKKVDCVKKTEYLFNDRDIYFCYFAFIIGKFDNRSTWFNFFELWNPGFETTMYVLAQNADGSLLFVKAYEVVGGFHIGFIGFHRCCIFASGFGGVTVSGVKLNVG